MAALSALSPSVETRDNSQLRGISHNGHGGNIDMKFEQETRPRLPGPTLCIYCLRLQALRSQVLHTPVPNLKGGNIRHDPGQKNPKPSGQVVEYFERSCGVHKFIFPYLQTHN